MDNKIKFFWNGLKINGNKLQFCHYSIGRYTDSSGIDPSTITIYLSKKNDSFHFSSDVNLFFNIKNDSDYQTDYFCSDYIRVAKDHYLYNQVFAALTKQNERHEKRFKKMMNNNNR